jgi:heme iron utilization protein
MAVDDSASAAAPADASPALAARRFMRQAVKGSLGTLLSDIPGHPYASLVLTATEPDGTPIFLISRLALHTKNLLADARASLLIDGTGELGNAMTGARLTLIGHARPLTSSTAMPRFIARHPSAQAYAAFSDFSPYALHIIRGHYIGGFGKIVDLPASDLLCDVTGAQELVAAESEILDHMNTDHRDAVALYATQIANCAAGDWRLSGIDVEGIDLLHRNIAARVTFSKPVHSPLEARMALVALAKEARTRIQQNPEP